MAAIADLPLEAASSEAAPLSREERKLFSAFIALIVIVTLPGKILFFISPGILILISVFAGGFVRFWRLIGITLGIAALSLVTMAYDSADGLHVNVPGLLFGVIDYLPIFTLWSLSKGFRVSEGFAWRLAAACLVLIYLEASIAAVQWVAGGGSNDLVSGTLGLLDNVTSQRTISQVNFTFMMFCLVAYCAIWVHKRRMALGCGVAMMTSLVSETAHQTLFFIAMMPVLSVTGRRRLLCLVAAICIGSVLVAGALFVDPDLETHVNDWVYKVVLMPQSPKRLSVTGAVEMMDGKNLLLGVGLGQFSSRAATLSSGSGTSVNLPKILVDTSTYYKWFMAPAIRAYGQNGEDSAMAMPYFSVLSVATEFGLVIAGVLLLKIAQTVIENVRLGAASPAAWRYSCYCNFFIGFLFLCSFIQNYLELTQAIMVPVLLYIVSKARLRTLAEEVVADTNAHARLNA